MDTVVLRGLTPELKTVIKRKAQAERLSVNKWLVKALRTVCGLEKQGLFPQHTDLDHLAGGWTKKDAEAFSASTKEFERIDKELWE
ncbi:MAG: hypothetical protein V1913_04560 [Fibrobacterota bacterium]